MLKELVKRTARLVAPQWAAQKEKELWNKKQARMLRKQYCKADIETVVDAMRASLLFHANQMRAEILPLLQLLSSHQPKYLCEIGSASGGTLFLLCQVAAPDARILSIDLNHNQIQKAVFPCFRRASQCITAMGADSHSSETHTRFELAGRQPTGLSFHRRRPHFPGSQIRLRDVRSACAGRRHCRLSRYRA